MIPDIKINLEWKVNMSKKISLCVGGVCPTIELCVGSVCPQATKIEDVVVLYDPSEDSRGKFKFTKEEFAEFLRRAKDGEIDKLLE